MLEISERIEDQYQEEYIGNEIEIADEAEFDEYGAGTGKWDGDSSLGCAVLFEGDVFTKARRESDDSDWILFQRTENGEWVQY